MPQNPLFDRSSPLPLFDRIEAGHFKPAMDALVAQAQVQITALAADETAPNIDTLAVPIDRILSEMERIIRIHEVMNYNVQSDAMKDAEAPLLQAGAQLQKMIFQHPVLAARFAALEAQGNAHLSGEDRQLLRVLHRRFEVQGAFLDAAGQEKLRAIDDALIAVTSAFARNDQAAARQCAVMIDDARELDGMDENSIAAYRTAAERNGKQGYMIVLERLQIEKLLANVHSRDVRRRLHDAMMATGTVPPHDNRPLVPEILKLRQARAQLLGYTDYAAFALADTMAQSLPRVMDAIDALARPALAVFENEIDAITTYAKSQGGPDVLQPWDSNYWAARYKEKYFNFDDKAFSQYLPFDQVLSGFFRHIEKLFDISFHANDQHPVYHPEVRSFDVMDNATGKVTGVIYVDPYARAAKRGGAWMEHIQFNMPGQMNCVIMTTNSLPGGVISHFETEVLFHEGGHAVHGLLGSGSRHGVLQGTQNTPDYTEIFSKIQERWASRPETLRDFARHHETGEPLPQALLDALKRSKAFFTSFTYLRSLQNAVLDMEFHRMQPDAFTSCEDFSRRTAFSHKYQAHLRPFTLQRYMHGFDEALSKYAAGYFGYYWANLHGAHAFAAFEKAGAYDADTAARLKAMYMGGAAGDRDQMYNAFAGPAQADALLPDLGLRASGLAPPAPKATPQ